MHNQEVACDAQRETNLSAVLSDTQRMSDHLNELYMTVMKLSDHLNGPQGQPVGPDSLGVKEQAPPVAGILVRLCHMGGDNLRLAATIQERVERLCYELGVG